MNVPEQPKDRSPGRPLGTREENLQRRLLDSAEKLFAEHGYAATPVRAIADDVGVNPALVHYYYGSKQKLLTAVLDRALEPLADAVASVREDGQEPTGRFIDLIFDLSAKHPALPRLIVREVILTDGELRSYFVTHYAPRLGGALPELLKREQEDGRIDRALHPGVMALLVISLCVFPLIAAPIAAPLLGVSYDQHGLENMRGHIRTVIESGVMR